MITAACSEISRAAFDDISAQLHRAEQNLHVEMSARKWSEQQAERMLEDAKSSARLAAEQAALFQKQQAALQTDLDTATQELERLHHEQSAAAERVSPTDSEQLLRAVQRAKQQRMQSQDCVRIMASSAAAAEARARQLQEALSATEKELYEARLKLIDLEMANKKQEQDIAESAGHLCRLRDEASAAAGQRRDYQQKVDLLQKHLERSQVRVHSLELQLRDTESLQQRASKQMASYRPLPMRHSADNLQSLDAFAETCNWLDQRPVCASLPSPLYRRLPDLEASICNLSSPAALHSSPPERKPVSQWPANASSNKSQQSLTSHHPSQKSNQENSPPRPARTFQLTGISSAERRAQAADNYPRQPGWTDPKGPSKVEETTLKDQIRGIAALQKYVLSDQVIRVLDPAAKELRSSDYGPLARGQRKLQPVEVVNDDSPQKQVLVRQPLSPVKAKSKNRVMQKSPFQKSSPPSALPTTASTLSPTASPENQIPQPVHWALNAALATEEERGPLGMGSRGVNEMHTPPKDKSTNAVHKGLMRLAHKVSPMRRAPFSSISTHRGPFLH